MQNRGGRRALWRAGALGESPFPVEGRPDRCEPSERAGGGELQPEWGGELSSFLSGQALPSGGAAGEDFPHASGVAELNSRFWAGKKPESGGDGATGRPLGPAASAHVPRVAGTRLPDPVQGVRGIPESASWRRPPWRLSLRPS